MSSLRPAADGILEIARSFLFVPGNRPDRFAKAALCGADEIVCDLEDAVAHTDKLSALSNTAAWLSNGGEACVRINGASTPWHLDDIEGLKGARGLRGVMVPKAEDAEALKHVSEALEHKVPLIALVETARGLLHARDIAAVPSVVRLAFGSIDFSLDVGAGEEPHALLFARSALVIAGRAGRTSPPIDGVTTAIADQDSLAEACAHAASLGFGGKLCIHPKQIETVNRSFSPSTREVAWAENVLAAAQGGQVTAVEGHMVDKPVIDKAELVLRKHRRFER